MNCYFCENRCDLSKGSLCGAYHLQDGAVTEVHPYQWTTCRTTLSEEIPMFHFAPRGKFLQLGGIYCNASCAYCMNARIVNKSHESENWIRLEEDAVLKMARQIGCIGIHFGVNEVICNLPSALRIAKAARQAGLYVGASTNGYFTQESAQLAADAFDFLNISLKSISPDHYRDIVGLPRVDAVLRNIAYLASRLHLEVTVPVIQGTNDQELPEIAQRLAAIDPELPLHIFRLLPEHRMQDQKPPDVFHLAQQVLALRQTLPFTYFSNFIGSQLDNTICPTCGTAVIRRLCTKSCGATLTAYHLHQGSTCPVCGRIIPITAPWREETEGVL